MGSFKRSERVAAETDQWGRLVTAVVLGSHGDGRTMVESFHYVIKPYIIIRFAAIR